MDPSLVIDSMDDSNAYKSIQEEDKSTDVENDPFQRATEQSDLSYIEEQNSKSFFGRNFSHISKGGIRGSVFTLFSSAVGAGVLSLPYVISYYGVVCGASGVLVFSLIAYRIQTIIWELIEETGKKTYANLFSHFFNKPVAKVVINFLIVSQFFSLILYSAVGKLPLM